MNGSITQKRIQGQAKDYQAGPFGVCAENDLQGVPSLQKNRGRKTSQEKRHNYQGQLATARSTDIRLGIGV